MVDLNLLALSCKYSNEVRIVLPLPNGHFAVFNAARELHAIVPASELLGTIIACPAPATRPEPPNQKLTIRGLAEPRADLDLEGFL